LDYLIYRYDSFLIFSIAELIKTKFWMNWQGLGLKCHLIVCHLIVVIQSHPV